MSDTMTCFCILLSSMLVNNNILFYSTFYSSQSTECSLHTLNQKF